MTDAISRSAVLEILTNNIVIHEDEIDLMEEVCHTIKAAPALDVAPVVHKKDIRSSVITAKDSDEWQDRIILADESTQVCAVYYADDSERVPVVRCRDCKYAIPLEGHAFRRWGNSALNCTECRGDDGFGMAGVSLAYRDGFCDRGVRMDGDMDAD